MSYELSMTEEPDYLCFQAKGIRTPETLFQIANDIIAASQERGYVRVLVDIREMPGQLKTMETFNIASEDFPRLGTALRRLRAAIVDREENRERFTFAENVSVNMGATARWFGDMDEAINWLCEHTRPPSE
ncbi:MAG: STAS/SEC14 domain-containing protein [Candidatus Thorarchaeota archaeon]|jgi:hypothetical protein